MKRVAIAMGWMTVLIACSGASGETVAGETPTATKPSPTEPPRDDGPSSPVSSGGNGGPVDRADGGSEAATESASVGGCAACTAGSCGKELNACAAVRACVDALLAFNDCFAKQTDGTSGACGPTFAQTNDAADTLWSCLEKKCTARCGAK